MIIRISGFVFTLLLTGCVTYKVVGPGEVDYGGIRVNTSQVWNQAPGSRSGSKVLTQDGFILDRIVIIPDVPDGETIFVAPSKESAMPAFRSDMLPNEIEEMTRASLIDVFGAGQAAVETSSLRPHKFGDHIGFLFDMEVTLSDGPSYKGVSGAFVVEDRLNMILYFGAYPYYYEKHYDEALVVIKGASY